MLFQFAHAAKQPVRNEHYQVWTHENHAVEISSFVKSKGRNKMDYSHNNPVRAEEYVYSSAGDYMVGRKGLVRLVMW